MIDDKLMYNHHPEQTGVWFKYNGWRYKLTYDIKLLDGTIVKNCYPNSNAWRGAERRFTDEEVDEVRLVPYEEQSTYKGMYKVTIVNSILKSYDSRTLPRRKVVEGKVVGYITKRR